MIISLKCSLECLKKTISRRTVCIGWRRETGKFEVDYEIPPAVKFLLHVGS
jgi:hypothetical protein